MATTKVVKKSSLKNGSVIHTKIQQKRYPGLEHGSLNTVHAVVVHQTDAPTAQHTFNAYTKDGHGAHILIDKLGAIYQTALVTKKTYHVGKLKSRCLGTKVCTQQELAAATNILYAKGKSFAVRIRELHKHEAKKNYPDRFPSNEDSIGIELVGAYNKTTKQYEAVTAAQNNSLKWLLNELYSHFALAKDDVYRHPTASRKHPTEASTATW
jgi:N-acetyl-anhydromuramyl-L-alanine amidase AmpD